ncbi:hypothetical protein AS194_02335 [Psychrobacter piscatorii]|uniref:Uncharacterized protein n=1 Tax=Psychrobacter piscatorii TaxID=554343 RepID=A0A0T6DPE4_9GAMM|nr:hypothetical protein AS194_02335 [Psychrobacter piscatorii]
MVAVQTVSVKRYDHHLNVAFVGIVFGHQDINVDYAIEYCLIADLTYQRPNPTNSAKPILF